MKAGVKSRRVMLERRPIQAATLFEALTGPEGGLAPADLFERLLKLPKSFI